MRWLSISFVTLWLLAATAQAASVQALLIRASNEAGTNDAPIQALAPKLQKSFGFKKYQQLGARTDELKLQKRSRLDLGKGFVVYATEKKADKKEHELEVEWYSCKTCLVKTTIKLMPGRQVFIKGPEVGKEWIILSLDIVK